MIGNWGKWGDKDERGALNYITHDVVKDSAKIIKKGKIYSLGLPIQQSGVPTFTDNQRRIGCVHFMRIDGGDFAAGSKRAGKLGVCACDDYLLLGGHATTHIDSLCHMWYEDKLYNGFSSNTIRSAGARFCGAEKLICIVTKGVMLDIPSYKGVDHLEEGYVITRDDLEGCLEKQGLGLKSGDALIIRTGWLKAYYKNPVGWETNQPGIGLDSVPFIVENQVSLVGADNAVLEAFPGNDPEKTFAVHGRLLRDYGIPIMELLVLEELARDEIYQFQFVAAPLRIVGGTASPINPLAIC